MNRGEIVLVDFPGVSQTKRRPAVVLSSADYAAHRPDVILGLITSQLGKSVAPTDWPLRHWQAAGLRVPSAFRAFIVTLPRHAVQSVVGQLSESDRDAVESRLRLALGL